MDNVEIIKTKDVLVRTMELDVNSSTDWHYHTEVGDLFVCLNGIVQVETKNPDIVVILNPGQRVEVKPTQIHRVLNIDKGKSEYLLVQGVGAYDFIKA